MRPLDIRKRFLPRSLNRSQGLLQSDRFKKSECVLLGTASRARIPNGGSSADGASETPVPDTFTSVAFLKLSKYLPPLGEWEIEGTNHGA